MTGGGRALMLLWHLWVPATNPSPVLLQPVCFLLLAPQSGLSDVLRDQDRPLPPLGLRSPGALPRAPGGLRTWGGEDTWA